VVHALVHAWMLILPGITTALARRYQVSELDVAAVGTAHYLAFGLGAVPAGWLADRFGPRAVLLLCLAGGGASAAACALAQGFAGFSVALVALGAAASLYHPAGLSMISRTTPHAGLGRALGIHGVGGNLGEALAPGAAALLAAQLDVRAPFVVAALSAAIVLWPVARLPRQPGAPEGGDDDDDRVGGLLTLPLLLVLCSALLAGLVYRGATYFFPVHLGARVAGGGETVGALVLSASLLAGVAAQWLGGRLADRFRRERLYLALQALALPILAIAAVTRQAVLVGAAIAFGFVWFLAQPLLTAFAAGLVARDKHGRLYGVLFTSTFGLGSLAVTACAHVAARWGTTGVFLSLAGCGAANVLVVALMIYSTRRTSTSLSPRISE
jgi:MFS family permease